MHLNDDQFPTYIIICIISFSAYPSSSPDSSLSTYSFHFSRVSVVSCPSPTSSSCRYVPLAHRRFFSCSSAFWTPEVHYTLVLIFLLLASTKEMANLLQLLFHVL